MQGPLPVRDPEVFVVARPLCRIGMLATGVARVLRHSERVRRLPRSPAASNLPTRRPT